MTNSISDRSPRPCNGLMELNKMNELEGKAKVLGEEKTVSVPLFSPQIPHALVWDPPWASVVSHWQLTISSMAEILFVVL